MHRIVLTRQPGQAGLLEKELAELNVDVELLPLLDFVLPADTGGLQQARTDLAEGVYDWVVLTSPNAVRALAKMDFFDFEADVRWGMVGGGTAAIFEQVTDLRADFVAEHNQSGEGLVAEFDSAEPTGRNAVLLPVSEIAADTVQTGLQAKGYTVTRVTAYQTVPADSRLSQDRRLLPAARGGTVHDAESLAGEVGAVTAVVLTSPSNARAYAGVAEDFPSLVLPPLLAIGQPTAQAMTATGLPITAVLPKPDARSVYRWLLEYLPSY